MGTVESGLWVTTRLADQLEKNTLASLEDLLADGRGDWATGIVLLFAVDLDSTLLDEAANCTFTLKELGLRHDFEKWRIRRVTNQIVPGECRHIVW